MRAAAALEAGDELQEDAVESVPEAGIVPLQFPGMLLALVEEQGLEVVRRHRIAGQVEVPVSEGLEDAQASAPTSAREQPVLSIQEAEHPCVTLHGGLLSLQCGTLLRQ